jgi:hypothetical protein
MTSWLQAAYNEVALANSRLRAEIERCREEQRVVLKHVEELRAEIERLTEAKMLADAEAREQITALRAEIELVSK